VVRQRTGSARRHEGRRRRCDHRSHRAGDRDVPVRKQLSDLAGPNSNTFIAFVLRQVPELRVDLPAHAVGKDYLGARVFARPPSGTEAQASIFGVLGLLAATEEGLEVNVLGLTFGLDPSDLALKLPLVGSIGFDAWDTPNSQ
jgi:hypothetical protein